MFRQYIPLDTSRTNGFTVSVRIVVLSVQLIVVRPLHGVPSLQATLCTFLPPSITQMSSFWCHCFETIPLMSPQVRKAVSEEGNLFQNSTPLPLNPVRGKVMMLWKKRMSLCGREMMCALWFADSSWTSTSWLCTFPTKLVYLKPRRSCTSVPEAATVLQLLDSESVCLWPHT